MFFGLMKDNWMKHVESRADYIIKTKRFSEDDLEEYNFELDRVTDLKKRQTKNSVITFLSGVSYITIDYFADGAISRNAPSLVNGAVMASLILSPLYGMGTRLERRSQENHLKKQYERVKNVPELTDLLI